MAVSRIGIIGSGVMGSGISHIAAEAGYEVVLYDINADSLLAGLNLVKKALEREVQKGRKEQDAIGLALGRIKSTTSLNDLREVDLIIEAVFELMSVKKEIYTEIDKICKPETVFASNTSGLSITEMASYTNRQDKVIGMHFFNPVQVMKLVEIIRGQSSSDGTFNCVMDVTKKLGKDPIVVEEAPLFVVNRILAPMINEAAYVLMEGIASAEDIDQGMRLGANHPIGPLALADLVGLDILLNALETLQRETGDSKYRPSYIIRKLVRAGHYGCKTGKGFYEYK